MLFAVHLLYNFDAFSIQYISILTWEPVLYHICKKAGTVTQSFSLNQSIHPPEGGSVPGQFPAFLTAAARAPLEGDLS